MDSNIDYRMEAEVQRLRNKVSELQQRLANALDDQEVEADLDEAMRLLEVEPELLDGRWNADYAALRARVEARREGKWRDDLRHHAEGCPHRSGAWDEPCGCLPPEARREGK